VVSGSVSETAPDAIIGCGFPGLSIAWQRRATMELRHLRYFIAVAEALHFRRAAELVHVAQPALSQQIHQLEQEIGTELFERSHNKVQLTRAGRAFYLRARTIVDEARQAVRDAQRAGRGETGTLAIGFVSAAGVSILPACLERVREQAPAADFDLRELATEEQIEELHRDKLDIGFFHATLGDEPFASMLVARDRVMVALSKRSPLSRRRTIDLRDLADQPAILPARHSRPGYYEYVRTAYQSAGVTPPREYHTRLLQTALLLVRAGLGVSLVPESFRSIRIEGVVYRPLRVELPPLELIAVWRKDNDLPLLSRLIGELRAKARG
jgi:DNA-binding transcriptional LysR family regulator